MSQSFGGKGLTEAETLRGRAWPCLRQFCVFLENRVGRLNELVKHVESVDLRIVGLTIVDSVDFAMVRLIFNNTDRAREKGADHTSTHNRAPMGRVPDRAVG